MSVVFNGDHETVYKDEVKSGTLSFGNIIGLTGVSVRFHGP